MLFLFLNKIIYWWVDFENYHFFIDHTYIFISNYFHDGYSKKEIKVNMAYKVNISTADLSTKLIEWLQADGVTRPFEDDVRRYYG